MIPPIDPWSIGETPRDTSKLRARPGLRVPTLVFDEGRALGESGAIVRHLAEGTRAGNGEHCWIADIAPYAHIDVAEEGGFDLAGYPAIGAWLPRVASRPGHIPITASAAISRSGSCRRR